MQDSAPTAQVDRKQQILMALAEMLEEAPDNRITIARIAAAVGVWKPRYIVTSRPNAACMPHSWSLLKTPSLA